MLKQNLNIPGPSELPLEVLHALGTQMVANRGDDRFSRALEEIVKSTQEIMNTKNEILLFTSSGTGGMESAIVNTLSPGDDILVCINGEFGSRFALIAEKFGVEIHRTESGWGKPINLDAVQEKLVEDHNKKIKAVFAIHNETSTGVLNDLEKLGSMVRRHGALFVVDAVSSVGAVEFRADQWHVDVAVTASQKGLMAPPGLSLICVSDKVWKAAEEAKMPRYYWDYRLARGLFGKTRGVPDSQLPGIPITPSIALIFALQKSLALLKKEGLANVYRRHRKISKALRAGVKALGLQLIADESFASPTVTVVLLPDELKGEEARQILREKYNIVIAPGQKKLHQNGIRIGHIGYMDLKDIIAVLTGLEGALAEKGLIDQSALGMGAGAAHRTYIAGE
ncbi:MAG TPA: alanine--glyoxylate aminotransferase family protein [Firmicutes bacterium]|nr:alanine--glyoxylate aminotransferase family protein [Bacillota bacterium]